MMEKKRVRSAIIGLGGIAWKFDKGNFYEGRAITHASAYKALGVQVIAGMDSSDKARAEFTKYTGVNAAASILEALADKPEVVSICSPTHLHFEHVMECLASGVRYIWLEKPATADYAKTRALQLEASSLGARILVGFQRRYMPAYQALLSRELGGISTISITYSRGLVTNGSHLLDVIAAIFPDEQIEVTSIQNKDTKNIESYLWTPSFTLRTSGGVTIQVIGLPVKYHCIEIHVYYENGRRAVLNSGAHFNSDMVVPNEIDERYYRLKSLDNKVGDLEQLNSNLPDMLEDLLFNSEREPLSNLNTAAFCEIIISEVKKLCI